MEIQAVRITPDIRQKYILVRAVANGEENLMLWGNPDIQWHKDILEEVKGAGYEVSEVLGGGWLLHKPEKGVVYVWGKSDRLGAAPLSLVQKVIKGEVVEEEP